MFTYFDIDEIHLEPTERCNAACPMCGRVASDGSPNPFLNNHEWTLDSFRSFLPNVLLERLRRLRFCGNFGEPAACQDLCEMIAHAKEVNPRLRVSLHTNGGLRSTQWWASLAAHFGEKDRVYFALDGLSDTHSVYRRQVSFEKVIENARAFISAGGRATWVMLVFKHNEHQVEEARALAASLGFDEFKTKFTKRFVQHKSLKPRSQVSGLEPSTLRAQPAKSAWSSIEVQPVQCRVARRKSIYLSARGEVFPCCWTASQAYAAEAGDERDKMSAAFTNFSAVSLHQFDLREILEGDAFQIVWPRMMTSLSTCKRICADPAKPFESQWS